MVAFWPINAALYCHGIGPPKDRITDAQSIAMARHGVALDWLRVGGATTAFVTPPWALALPWPTAVAPRDPLALQIALAGVAAFVDWLTASL